MKNFAYIILTTTLFATGFPWPCGANVELKANKIILAQSVMAKQRAVFTEKKIKELRLEMNSLRDDLKALEIQETAASNDYVQYETDLKTRMRSAVVPLLNWSDRSDDFRLQAWITREHHQAVLDVMRDQIIKQPIKLLKERSDRLSAIRSLRESSSEKLASLESRRNLLQVQLEEWKQFQKAKKPSPKKGVSQP